MASGRQLYNLAPLLPYIERGFTLLTPNQRLARRIKAQWDELQHPSGPAAWTPLPVAPLEVWLLQRWRLAAQQGSVPARVILDDARCRLLWQQVVAQDAGEIELSLLRPAAAAEQAASARDTLIRWQLDPDSEELAPEFGFDADCTAFQRWRREFVRRLEEGGLVTPSDCLAELAKNARCQPGLRLLLADFDEIPPLHRACLDALAEEIVALDSNGTPAEYSCRAYPDKQAELAAVARWVVACRRADPDATVGVVLADMQRDRAPLEYLLRREHDCLGENYSSLPVNFSTGLSLDRVPVVRDALDILGSCTGTLPLGVVPALLQSRFTAIDDGHTDLGVKLISRVYEDGLGQVDPGRLRHLASTIKLKADSEPGLQLGAVLSAQSDLRLGRLRLLPSGWLEPICAILDYWGWPGTGPLDSLEYQQVEHWYRTLEEYAAHDQVSGPVSFEDMLQALRFCCQRQPSQPQTADSPVQVLGPLEAAGLAFDHLWLCGLQGSLWPPAPRPNPFIPLPLQRRYDMPHATPDREWRFVERLTQQFLHSANRLIASYCKELEGVPELPSALLADWPQEAVSEDPASLPPSWIDMRRRISLESRRVEPAPALDDDERHTLHGGSATLADQANCPFRAFALRRLQTRPLEDLRVGLSAAERGELVHEALFVLWGMLGDSDTLRQQEAAALRTQVARSAEAAIEKHGPRLRPLVGAAALDLERLRLDSLLAQWLQLELARPPFRVIDLESEVSVSLAGLELSLRIDRIDELQAGGRLIIDYKTSRNGLADWLGERPKAPQLPLYAIAGGTVSGLAYAELKPRQLRLLGLAEAGGIDGVRSDIDKAVGRHSAAGTWQQLLQEWQRNLSRLARAFEQGEAQVDPLRGACDYCGLPSLCRVDLEALEQEVEP